MRELQTRYGGLGQFALDKHLIYDADPALMQAILFGMIIISAEHHWEGNRIIYRGFHPDFREIAVGDMGADYIPIVTRQEDLNEEGDRIYTVEWKEINNRA